MANRLTRLRRAIAYSAWVIQGVLTQRALLHAMWRFERALPDTFSRKPLPELMQELTPASRELDASPDAVRRLADAVAGLDLRSPFGICLRRSLLRYYFLRRAGVPVVIHFGARFQDDERQRDIAGHAWLTLQGVPYHEDTENYLGFAHMYSFPISGG